MGKAKNLICCAYDAINETKILASEYGLTDRDIAPTIRYLRNEIRKLQRGRADGLALSLSEDWRHSVDECGEWGRDYRVIPDNGESEEEIMEAVQNEIGYPEICSPYDCTGKPLTRFISVKRVPVGFAVIHQWALDV